LKILGLIAEWLNWTGGRVIKWAGWKYHAVPVQHWSRRGLLDTNKVLWAGWVIEAPDKRLFFAGDTGYSKDFKDIGERFKSMDLSLIPIGAYAPTLVYERYALQSRRGGSNPFGCQK
jgi:N-acyl-phosphatidylethanolamine-hydrolysing phospholipase D